MKTIELDAPLEAQLEAARRLTGQDDLEIFRDAMSAHWENLQSSNGAAHNGDVEKDERPLSEQWAHLIGTIRTTDGVSHAAENSEKIFAEVMKEKEARIMGRTE